MVHKLSSIKHLESLGIPIPARPFRKISIPSSDLNPIILARLVGQAQAFSAQNGCRTFVLAVRDSELGHYRYRIGASLRQTEGARVLGWAEPTGTYTNNIL